MAETKEQLLNRLYKKYNIGVPVTKAKEVKEQSLFERAMNAVKKTKKPKKQKITLPSGVKTPKQIKEFKEIMEIK